MCLSENDRACVSESENICVAESDRVRVSNSGNVCVLESERGFDTHATKMPPVEISASVDYRGTSLITPPQDQ